MTAASLMPTRSEAEALLAWAEARNPGPWSCHSLTAARAAGAIASACGMDPERAYVMGLLHDIGRYEGRSSLRHTIAGYDLLMDKGWLDCARICLTHSFTAYQLDEYIGPNDCDAATTARIKALLDKVTLTDEDRLIQLCDALAMAEGVRLIDSRLMDVGLRHGLTAAMTDKWRRVYALKDHFDRLAGHNIYELFESDILSGVREQIHRQPTP